MFCPISNLSVVAKIMESLVNTQLKEFLQNNGSRSGFRSGNSTITAALQVISYKLSIAKITVLHYLLIY